MDGIPNVAGAVSLPILGTWGRTDRRGLAR